MPAAKTEDTLSFFSTEILKCQMVHIGKIKIKISDSTLMVPVTIRLRLALVQTPWMDGIHAFCTGVQWKIMESTLAR